MATSSSIDSLLKATFALSEAIRELGSVPSGHLYARVMGAMNLATYNSIIGTLKGAKLVSESNDVLIWVGPNIAVTAVTETGNDYKVTVVVPKQPTVREINAHLASSTSYCYVDLPNGGRLRISRARTRKGVVEGRVILGSPKAWEVIPANAIIELS